MSQRIFCIVVSEIFFHVLDVSTIIFMAVISFCIVDASNFFRHRSAIFNLLNVSSAVFSFQPSFSPKLKSVGNKRENPRQETMEVEGGEKRVRGG